MDASAEVGERRGEAARDATPSRTRPSRPLAGQHQGSWLVGPTPLAVAMRHDDRHTVLGSRRAEVARAANDQLGIQAMRASRRAEAGRASGGVGGPTCPASPLFAVFRSRTEDGDGRGDLQSRHGASMAHLVPFAGVRSNPVSPFSAVASSVSVRPHPHRQRSGR